MRSIGFALGWFVVLTITTGLWRALNRDFDPERVEMPFTPQWWRNLMLSFGLMGAALWLVWRGL